MTHGPLTGLRVVEFAGLAPAPFAAMMLADHGAEVVRVDRRTPTVAAPDALGRGRSVLHVDLKDTEQRAAVRELVDRADVLVEGFRPGVMERLGLGPEECLASNPRLVYGRMTGWGQTGALATVAGHDINYIAMSGALGAIGPAGAEPVPPVNFLGDFGGGGLLLAFGILAALVERSRSGRGQVVDAAMVDGAALFTTHLHSMKAEGGWNAPRGKNRLDGGAPYYRCYRTADGGYVSVGAIEPQFYAKLLEGLGLDPAELPEQNDEEAWPKLHAVFEAAFLERTRQEWAEVFAGSDACVHPVLEPEEFLDSPLARERRAVVEVGDTPQPAPAPRFGRSTAPPPGPRRPATTETLAGWELPPAAIDVLRRCSPS